MLKTKSGLPKHCTWETDRHGKRRVRFRRAGVSAYLPGVPWSEENLRAYAEASQRAQAPELRASGGGGGTGSIDALVSSYRELVFPTLAETTRGMRSGILVRFCREFGRDLVVNFEHRHVAKIIAARAQTPHAANNLRKVLRHLFKHAVRLGWRKDNPVTETDRLKTTGDGIHTWTDAEIQLFRNHWPLGTQQRLCFEIALETTLRRSDVTKLGPQHIRGDKIRIHHSKNATANLITISRELRAAIEACPTKHLTFLHTKHGASRSPKALGGDFRSWCDAAGLPKHCSIHGLRKGATRRMAESDVTTREIMAITGHKTLAEVQRYTDAADRERLADSAIAKLSKGRKAL